MRLSRSARALLSLLLSNHPRVDKRSLDFKPNNLCFIAAGTFVIPEPICIHSVADADVITALIAVGIMEPVVSNTAEGGVRQGGDAFKAEDTAALRATAVQVNLGLPCDVP